jgi:high-affinity nickel permease
MNSALKITLLSCAVLGFRHGFDYDHIAAISDIASVQKKASTAMRLGLLYALGHAAMIALLGSCVILTLILLAIYVMGSLVWGNPQAIPPSRAAIIIRAYRRLRRRFWPRVGDAIVHSESDDALNYTGPIAFGVGIIHGLGAETPSQLALFLLAANLGGVGRGVAGMSMFLAGLLIMNTLMTASASGLFHGAAPHPKAMRVFVGLTAVYSFVVGWVFLLGAAGHLPALG